MDCEIHPTADVQSSNIGNGTKIWQFVVILSDAVIGKNCNLNMNVFIENNVHIGNNVTIKPGVQIWDGITLENNVFVGPNATFTNDYSPRSKQYPNDFLKTLVKEGASIGANATIMGGNSIGRYSLIGAGSVVTKAVGDFELWIGNPAKHIGYVTKDGKILDINLRVKNSKEQYQFINGELKLLL